MATSVIYAAVLTAREETVLFLSGLLHAERQRRGTRAGRRALGCFAQAVLVLRWFLDGTRLRQLATDNAIGGSTAYRYLHEGIDVLAGRRPGLHAALLASKWSPPRTGGHCGPPTCGQAASTTRPAPAAAVCCR